MKAAQTMLLVLLNALFAVVDHHRIKIVPLVNATALLEHGKSQQTHAYVKLDLESQQ